MLAGGEEEGWRADGGLFTEGDKWVRKTSCCRIFILKYFSLICKKDPSLLFYSFQKRLYSFLLASCQHGACSLVQTRIPCFVKTRDPDYIEWFLFPPNIKKQYPFILHMFSFLLLFPSVGEFENPSTYKYENDFVNHSLVALCIRIRPRGVCESTGSLSFRETNGP